MAAVNSVPQCAKQGAVLVNLYSHSVRWLLLSLFYRSEKVGSEWGRGTERDLCPWVPIYEHITKC